MQLEDMKAVSRRMLGLWAGSSTDHPHEFIAESYVNHQEPFAEDGSSDIGLDRWLELVGHHRVAFPDCTVEILTQLAEGDKVATRWRFSATNTGSYRGKAPTGRKVSWTGIEIDVFEDGKIAESFVDWDMHRQLEQLGHLE